MALANSAGESNGEISAAQASWNMRATCWQETVWVKWRERQNEEGHQAKWKSQTIAGGGK